MAGLYRLRIQSGLTPGETFPLEKPETSIGRDISCDIVLPDIEVSRRHALIHIDHNGCKIEDMGSTNGIFVNQQLVIGSAALQPGDIIGLGQSVTLLFDHAVFSGDDIKAMPRESVQTDSVEKKADSSLQRPKPVIYLRDLFKKPLSRWMLIMLVILAAGLLFCLVPTLILELTNSWCRLFGGLFNVLKPLSCP